MLDFFSWTEEKDLASASHCHRFYLRLRCSVAQKCQHAIATVTP